MMDLPAKGKWEVRKGHQWPTVTQIIRPIQAVMVCQKTVYANKWLVCKQPMLYAGGTWSQTALAVWKKFP